LSTADEILQRSDKRPAVPRRPGRCYVATKSRDRRPSVTWRRWVFGRLAFFPQQNGVLRHICVEPRSRAGGGSQEKYQPGVCSWILTAGSGCVLAWTAWCLSPIGTARSLGWFGRWGMTPDSNEIDEARQLVVPRISDRAHRRRHRAPPPCCPCTRSRRRLR
jgi:hypothetical protein